MGRSCPSVSSILFIRSSAQSSTGLKFRSTAGYPRAGPLPLLSQQGEANRKLPRLGCSYTPSTQPRTHRKQISGGQSDLKQSATVTPQVLPQENPHGRKHRLGPGPQLSIDKLLLSSHQSPRMVVVNPRATPQDKHLTHCAGQAQLQPQQTPHSTPSPNLGPKTWQPEFDKFATAKGRVCVRVPTPASFTASLH